MSPTRETATYEIVIGPVADYKRVGGAPRGEGQDRVVVHEGRGCRFYVYLGFNRQLLEFAKSILVMVGFGDCQSLTAFRVQKTTGRFVTLSYVKKRKIRLI